MLLNKEADRTLSHWPHNRYLQLDNHFNSYTLLTCV